MSDTLFKAGEKLADALDMLTDYGSMSHAEWVEKHPEFEAEREMIRQLNPQISGRQASLKLIRNRIEAALVEIGVKP